MNPETYTLHKGTILYRGDTPFYVRTKNTQLGRYDWNPIIDLPFSHLVQTM